VKSIRVFLVSVILATIILFNFLAALHGYQASMSEAERLFDRQLQETAYLIASIDITNENKELATNSDLAFQVWKNGQLLAASSNTAATRISDPGEGLSYYNFNGYRWRTLNYTDPAIGQLIIVAQRMDTRYTLAESVILESIFPIMLGIPIIGLLIWFIVGHGLKPLRSLAIELGLKQTSDLSPVRLEAPVLELERIVYSSNLLLGRLESSLQREKQFASDAAHELRTPISILKVQLYNLHQELPAQSESLEEIAQTTDRLSHLVEQILDLYRSSPDQYMANFEPVDLDVLVQDVIATEYPNFEAKHQQLEYKGEACTVPGDKFSISSLFQNLLANACKYTPDGGSIRISVQPYPDTICLIVEDSGPGIAEEYRDSVLERFYRIGGDRHASGEPGCGLGLAIVKHIVALHNATLTISDSNFDSGARFQITFRRNLGLKSAQNKAVALP
jgi:two-component system, OmpR family, sensor histidine kinase QseC